MDRLRDMEVFVTVAKAGSFAAAGRSLAMSPPAVSRSIAALEARLGVRLINRTTRSLALTEPGARFVAHCERLLAEIEAAERDAAGEATSPQGHLQITASVTFGRVALTPGIGRFLAAHPRITVSLTLLDRVTNLIDEGFDVGVRIGPLPSSSLIARRIGAVRRMMVASPDYLARRGTPAHPSDLALHSVIGFTGLNANREFRFSEGGREVAVPLTPRIEVNDAEAAIAASVSGEGITTSICYMVGRHIAAGGLVPVLAPFWPAPAPVHVVFHEARLMAAKVRAFVDWAARDLADDLTRLSNAETLGP